MSSFKNRSDYFKSIAMQNKLIAHNLLMQDGTRRMSYHRINDAEELNAAATEWGHFPCVVHVGYEVRYLQPTTGALPKKTLINHLWFLSKGDNETYAINPDAVEAAYDDAYEVMSQFISFMLNDEDCCYGFNMNGAHAEMIGPEVNNLYGWHLTIQDNKNSNELKYNAADWLGNPDDTPGDGTGIIPDYTNITVEPEIIPFYSYENKKTIIWNATRKAKFGSAPTIIVYYTEDDGLRLSTQSIITPDQLPPMQTQFVITLNTPGPGVIIIK